MDGGSDDDLARKAVISFDFDDYDSIEQDGVISVKELVSKLLTQWERYVTLAPVFHCWLRSVFSGCCYCLHGCLHGGDQITHSCLWDHDAGHAYT